MTTVQAFWKVFHQTLGKTGKNSPILPAKGKPGVIAPVSPRGKPPASAVLSLHEILTERTKKLKEYPHNQSFVRAYLEYYLPLNFFKFLDVLQKTEKSSELLGKPPFDLGLKWVDFGCGPGTATLAALCFHADQVAKGLTKAGLVQVQLVDHSKHMLENAVKIIEALCRELGIAVEITTALQPKPFKFDSIFMANALNEIDEDIVALLEPWFGSKSFAQEATGDIQIVLLEPSHRVSSQRLIRFRERFRALGWEFIAPCTHQGTCPLLRSKHWCHFSEKTNDETLIQLNQSVFNDPRLYLKYSYLVAKKSAAQNSQATVDVLAKPAEEIFRAIGDWHLAGAGHEGIDLCQPEQKLLLKVTIPDATKAARGGLPRRGNLVALTAKDLDMHRVRREGSSIEELKTHPLAWKILDQSGNGAARVKKPKNLIPTRRLVRPAR